MKQIKVSLIVPCFNEEAVIKTTHQRIQQVFSENQLNGEIIYINDGSSDNTLKYLEEIAESNRMVKVISFSRNFGHQPAVTAGINNCTGDVAIIIDADLQDPPELIPGMLTLYSEKEYNVIYGVRTARKGETFFKKITAKFFYRFLNYLSDVTLPKDSGDFRLIDRKVINEFHKLKEKNKYIRGLIGWIGFKQAPFYYQRDARFSGETKYPFTKMIKFATNGLLYFTKKPLNLAVTLGFFCLIIGLILSFYAIYSKLSNKIDVVPGWASTVIIIIFFGGVQLLSVGLLGKYIGCIFDEVKDRPEFIIDKKINF